MGWGSKSLYFSVLPRWVLCMPRLGNHGPQLFFVQLSFFAGRAIIWPSLHVAIVTVTDFYMKLCNIIRLIRKKYDPHGSVTDYWHSHTNAVQQSKINFKITASLYYHIWNKHELHKIYGFLPNTPSLSRLLFHIPPAPQSSPITIALFLHCQPRWEHFTPSLHQFSLKFCITESQKASLAMAGSSLEVEGRLRVGHTQSYSSEPQERRVWENAHKITLIPTCL